MITLMGRPLNQIAAEDYYAMLKELNFKPGVVDLNKLDA